MTVSVFFLIMYAVCSEPWHHCDCVWCLFHQNAVTAFLKSSASASSFWFSGSELHVKAVALCLIPAGDRNSPWTEGFLEVDTKKLWEPMTSSISLSKGKLYIHPKFSRDLPCCCIKRSVQRFQHRCGWEAGLRSVLNILRVRKFFLVF